LHIKCVFSRKLFLYNFCLKQSSFHIIRIQQDIITNVHGSSRKVPVTLVGFQTNLNFLDRFSKNPQIENIIKIYPVGDKSFHANSWTDMTKLTVA